MNKLLLSLSFWALLGLRVFAQTGTVHNLAATAVSGSNVAISQVVGLSGSLGALQTGITTNAAAIVSASAAILSTVNSGTAALQSQITANGAAISSGSSKEATDYTTLTGLISTNAAAIVSASTSLGSLISSGSSKEASDIAGVSGTLGTLTSLILSGSSKEAGDYTTLTGLISTNAAAIVSASTSLQTQITGNGVLISSGSTKEAGDFTTLNGRISSGSAQEASDVASLSGLTASGSTKEASDVSALAAIVASGTGNLSSLINSSASALNTALVSASNTLQAQITANGAAIATGSTKEAADVLTLNGLVLSSSSALQSGISSNAALILSSSSALQSSIATNAALIVSSSSALQSQITLNGTNNISVSRVTGLAPVATTGTLAFSNLTGSATASQLPVATGSTAGIVTAGSGITIASGTISASASGITTIPQGHTIYVDAVNGNDGTALAYRVDKPFATINAAVTSSTTGDWVEILSGTYTAVHVAKDYINVFAHAGAVISGSNPVFSIGTDANGNGTILGAASITGTAGTSYTVGNGATALGYVQAYSITNTVTGAPLLYFINKAIVSGSLTANHQNLTGNRDVGMVNGCGWIDCPNINSGGASSVAFNTQGNLVVVSNNITCGNLIWSGYANNITFYTAGTINCSAAVAYGYGAAWAGGTANFYGGTLNFVGYSGGVGGFSAGVYNSGSVKWNLNNMTVTTSGAMDGPSSLLQSGSILDFRDCNINCASWTTGGTAASIYLRNCRVNLGSGQLYINSGTCPNLFKVYGQATLITTGTSCIDAASANTLYPFGQVLSNKAAGANITWGTGTTFISDATNVK